MDFDMDFGSEIPTDGPTTVVMVNAIRERFDEDDLAKFQELLLDVEKPLYKGCLDFIKLSAIVKLLNLKGKYGASDKFFTEFLGLLKKMLPTDSQACCTINEKFSKIAKDLRNLRLGISDDGVDVSSGTRHHNEWPGLSVIYNLPRWLCMKRKFIMLSTWVDTYDASTKENFNLRAILLWTINDYPALEKSVCESLVRTLLNVHGKTKDGMNARLDLAELGIKPKLFARQKEDKTTLPPAGYTLTNAKKDIFCDMLSNIRVPQGYCSNFSSLVSLKDRKLIGLKSHDYHMLMQEFLPITIRSIMHPPTRYAIIRFCFFFKFICRKEISLHELDKLQLELVMTLCLLEKFFPLSFFDIVIHLTVHLTREVTQASFKNKNPGKRIALLENNHSKSFAKWLREEVERELAISKDSVSETVRWITYGPRATIVKYEAYNINGYTFHMKSNDGIIYQNSEVSVEAVDLYISKEVATTRKAFYYGVLQEIWVLDYRFRQIPLFKCDWVNHNRVKHDPNLGYTLVDLNILGHKDDPFILVSQARQVFYVKDQMDKKLSIVFRTPTKNYKDTYDEVDEEFSIVIYEHNDNILPRVN
nr:hypothetical protein [Tanacetum cinerariifolium]